LATVFHGIWFEKVLQMNIDNVFDNCADTICSPVSSNDSTTVLANHLRTYFAVLVGHNKWISLSVENNVNGIIFMLYEINL
jgi:hypothetical protein